MAVYGPSYLTSNLDFTENTLVDPSSPDCMSCSCILFYILFIILCEVVSNHLFSKRLILDIILCQTLFLLMTTLEVGESYFQYLAIP